MVILDVRLPKMGGLQVLEIIRQSWANSPVIVLTGQVELNLAVEVMRKGAFDFLTKPIRTAALAASVEKAIVFKRLIDENNRLAAENEAYQKNLERNWWSSVPGIADVQPAHPALDSGAVAAHRKDISGWAPLLGGLLATSTTS